jgi:hypothetical protein
MKQILRAVFLFSMAVVSVIAINLHVLGGWRLPTKADETGGWAEFAEEGRAPNFIQADFDGDGIQDVAYFALGVEGENPGWALFVNLNDRKSAPRIMKLDSNPGNIPPQSMGVYIAYPGKHKTACGKGYWKCRDGEAPELDLKFPAINLRMFEGASSFFWWDQHACMFQRTWMND